MDQKRFMHCGHAPQLDVWSLVRGKIQKWPTDTDTDLFGLFSRDCMECSIEDTEMWAMLVWAMLEWAIWNSMSKYYFENTQLQQILDMA